MWNVSMIPKGFRKGSDPIADIPDFFIRIQSWSPETFLNASADPAVQDDGVATILNMITGNPNAIQTTGALRCIWKENQINGHGAILGDEFGQGYDFEAQVDLGNDYSICFVSVVNSTGSTRVISTGGTNALLSSGRPGNAIYLNGNVVDSMSSYKDVWTIGSLRCSVTNGESNFRANGEDITENPAITTNWPDLKIAGRGLFPEGIGGYFAAVFAFKRYITDSEVEKVERYISSKTLIPLI